MNRRTLLSGLLVSIVGVAGCMGMNRREVTALVCNQTGHRVDGEYRVKNPQSDEVAAYAPFALSAEQTATKSEPAQSNSCEEFTSELVSGRAYEFIVELQSGRTGSHEWEVSGENSFQIGIHADDIEFRQLSNPSPEGVSPLYFG